MNTVRQTGLLPQYNSVHEAGAQAPIGAKPVPPAAGPEQTQLDPKDQVSQSSGASGKAAPVDLIEVDRAAMMPLPPIPLHLGWRNKIRLGRDYYVRLDTNDYSVDPNLIGRMVDVAADLERVRIRAEGRVVAEHRRVWARGMTITDPTHVETAAWLRKQFQQPRAVAAAGSDLVRDLSDYDRAFGISGVEEIG